MQRPRPTSSGGTNRRFFRHSVATSIATPVTALLQLLVLLALHPPIAEAQGFSFALPEAISGDLAGTRAVRMADMDRDGDLDVVASSLGNNIVWIENLDGDVSSVTTHYISEFGGGTWALDVGDIDSDGIPDVLATRTGSDEVQWFGRTSLTSNTWTMVSLGPFADPAVARLADMDSDGDLDVIVTSNSEDYIRWRRNENGLGTVWGAVSNLPIVGGADFKVVDLDQDGDLDFVVAGQLEDEIRWWQNTNGLGTLWSVTDLTGGLDGAWSVDVGDIDHDGDLDIAASGQEAGEIIILENSGSSPPTFTSSSLDDGFAGAREVRLVDIDQDGDLDVLGVSELSGELALWENWRGPSGIGDLQWRRWSISTMAAAAWSFDAGDLDGDGDLDLISARPFLSDPVVWFRNDSPHSRRTVGRGSVRELLASYGGGFNGVTIGDIDGDGAADIVAGGDAHLGWWTGPDSLNPGVRTGISAENGQYNNDLELADLDHDGDLDIVAASRATSPGSAFWWENLGAGATWVRQTVGFSNSSLVEVVDLFGTGERVIVTAGPNTNTSIRAYGPPFLTSGGQLTLVGTHGANAFAIGDMDRDGDLDLVAGGYGIASEAALMLAEQDSGSFTEVNLSDSRIDDLELIDWDGDGDLDIIAVNKSPGQILWFENIPGVTWDFVEHDITPNIFGDPIDSYDEVVVGDFDHDDHSELWAVNTITFSPPDGSPSAIRLEWGDPNYQDWIIEGSTGIRLQVTDIDLDGDDDLIILDRDLDVISSLNIAADDFILDGNHTGLNDAIFRGVEYRSLSTRFENQTLDSDGPLSLDSLVIRWESRPPTWPAESGQVLSKAQVSTIIDNVRVFIDDGDNVFNEAFDTLLAATDDLPFVDDRLVLEFPPGLATVEPAQDRRVWFFFTPKLSAPPIAHLGIEMDSLPDIRHLATNSPIHRGYTQGFGAGHVLEEDPNALFRDGFESGSTSAWSGN